MNLNYLPNGSIEPGIFTLEWQEFVNIYGYNVHRQTLLSGLKMALLILRSFGCQEIFIGGSFVTKKQLPGDFDGCYAADIIDLNGLFAKHPEFFEYPPRPRQKKIYKGELLPIGRNNSILTFFQTDRNGDPVGIIKIDLNTIS